MGQTGMRRWSAAMCAFALCGCGGGSGEGSSGAVTVVPVATLAPSPAPSPSPASSPTPSPSPAPSPTPSPTPLAASWTAAAAALYDVQPDVANCRTGTLKASVKAGFLARLNAIRTLHKLPAVTYSSAEDEEEAQSSLMMAANGALSHTPPASWKCHTASGAAGAGMSNLVGGVVSPYLIRYSEEDFLALWLTEAGSRDTGHRRWMLDPFLGKTSYGRVAQVLADGSRTDSASMRVFSFAGGVAVPAGLPGYVAYPFGDYPQRYFGAGDYLSFSVVASAAARGGNGAVDFSRATITVTAPDGAVLTVANRTNDNLGYGLPNNLQWTVAGLQPGVSYTVRIGGVAGAPASEYSYQFRMVS